MKPKISRRAAAIKAGKNGSARFRYFCETCGKMRMHYSSDTKCVLCTKQRKKRESEARRRDPELHKEYCEIRRKVYRGDIGKSREEAAAREWRKATKADRMHAWYEHERETMRAVYAGLIEAKRGNEPDKKLKMFRQHGDHLIPKVGKGVIDGEEVTVVNGLHTFANLAAMSGVLNQSKGSAFAPDPCRYQRSANRHPGGAWDPELTPEEREHIQQIWTVEGVPLEESLRTHRDLLDRDARAFEEHARRVHDAAILVDPAWFECVVFPEWKVLEGPRYKGFEVEPDEETVGAFTALVR